jgi:transposase
VRARTRDVAVACPGCGTPTARVHGYYERTAADVPVGGRRVLVRVRVRRLRCPVPGCPWQTFREQVPGVLDRYQRRTTRLTGQVSAVARELAGRAGARLLPALGILASPTVLRVLLRIPLPAIAVPAVLGIDDFALRRGLVYATVLTGAGTGRRVDVLPGRTADLVGEWLRAHPGVQVVCRDGPVAYGEAVRRALPGAVQVSDRWHLWNGLAGAVQRESRRTAPAGPGPARRRPESAPGRPWSAGSRSTTCLARAPGLRPPPGPVRQDGQAVRAR